MAKKIENLMEVAEHLQREDLIPNMEYIEQESEWCVRIDYAGEKSLWLYSSGETDGRAPIKAKPYLKSQGFQIS